MEMNLVAIVVAIARVGRDYEVPADIICEVMDEFGENPEDWIKDAISDMIIKAYQKRKC